MWDLVERLIVTLWMLRLPVAVCALIFGGMAAINEIGSWHDRDAASDAAQYSCTGAHASREATEPSCR